jgi:hypothetical protein
MAFNIPTWVLKEIQPEVISSDEINFTNKSDDMMNDADLLNVVYSRRVRGDFTHVVGNSRLGAVICKHPSYNFGSIEDFSIDTYPASMIRCKGTEITQIERQSKTYKGKAFISRHFLSRALMWWSYAMHIRYTWREVKAYDKDNKLTLYIDDSDATKTTGINLWKHTLKYNHKIVGKTILVDGRKKVEQYLEPLLKTSQVDTLTGEDVILIIKDLLFLIRNKTPDDINDALTRGSMSEQFYYILKTQASREHLSYIELLQKFKSRLYYDEQLGECIWAYPKLQVEYLLSVLEELQSGYYHTDLPIAIVHHPYKYPLKCTGMTSETPRTDEEHARAKSDYDLTQFFEEERAN